MQIKKNKTGYKNHFEYDDKGRLVKMKDNFGEQLIDYDDERGQIIYTNMWGKQDIFLLAENEVCLLYLEGLYIVPKHNLEFVLESYPQ